MTTPRELIDIALDETTADECVVIVRASSTANLRWANNTLTTNGLSNSLQATVLSIVAGATGRRAGVLTGSATTTAQMRSLVADADAAARSAPQAEDDAPLVAGGAAPGFDDAPGLTSVDSLAAFAHELGTSLEEAQGDGRLLYGYVEQDVATTYVASSSGLRLRYVQPTSHFGMTGKPRDLSTSAWVGQAVERIEDFDVPSLTAELVRRIGWGSRKVDLPAGRYETILSPTAVSDLMIYNYYVASGRDAFEGQTVYSDPAGGTKVGQHVADPGVHLFSDPQYSGLTATPFVVATASNSFQSVFDNGLSLSSTDWIRDGRLQSLATSRHTSTMTGLPLTPPVDNLVLSIGGGHGTVDDLVGSSKRALLITCLWYIREVDPQTLLLTGLTRDGVYLVEDGEVVGAVNNFRFNESPPDLLNRFSEAGATVRSFSREWGDDFPRTAMPPLRIPDFNMSTVSQAS